MWTKVFAKFRREAIVLSAALLLIVSLLGGIIAMPATAEESSLKERVEKAISEVTVSNTAIASDFVKSVKNKLGSGYEVTVLDKDWYLVKAVSGCKDKDGMLFEGYDGFAAGIVHVKYGAKEVDVPFNVTIKPSIMSYTFASTAKCDYFYPDPDNLDCLRGDVPGRNEYFTVSKDGKNLVGYSGSAEKIIMPEGIETMDQSWWLDTDLSAVRCLILPDSLKVLPDQFAVPFAKNIEVIIMGDNVTVAEGKHSFWKCFYLKNLRLSDNLENLNEEALFESISLGELKLPSKLKSIGQGAFHLSALRDIVVPAGVTEILPEAFCWPMRKAAYIAEGTRTQGNAVPTKITNEVEGYLQTLVFDSSGLVLPRTITILSKDAKYNAIGTKCWNTAYSWSPIKVRYLAGSTTEDLVKEGYKPEAVTYEVLNMQPQEIKGHAMIALESVPITAKTTANDIKSYLKNKIVSTSLKDITVSDYKYTAPTDKENGSATAQIEITCADGTITLELNRTLLNHPKFEVGKERREPIIKPVETEEENEYLQAVLLTDKDEYKANEPILVTLQLGNKSIFNLTDVRVSFNVPDDLAVKSGSATPLEFDIEPEASTKKELTVIQKVSQDGQVVNGVRIEKNNAQSREPAVLHFVKQNPAVSTLCIIIAVLCVAAFVFFARKKNLKLKLRGISMLLCVVLFAGVIAFPVMRANAASQRVTVLKRISVDGERFTISATVTFNLSEDAVADNDNNYTVDWDIKE